MWLPGTNEVIEVLNSFYFDNYKAVFNKYYAELEFATILTYYSGSCAIVVNINSMPDTSAVTTMCVMLECNENDLCDLTDDKLHSFFQYKLLEKYEGLLELNRLFCSKKINRKVIFINTNFDESILNLKLEKETLRIELNYSKIRKISDYDKDFLNAIETLSEHLKN